MTVPLPGSARFAAEDHFIEDISSRARVPIAWLGGTFKRRLLAKIEQDVEGVAVNVYRLRLSSSNRSILAELGERPETKLAHVWEMLAGQPLGEPGPLLTNVRANVFYIRDMDGTLWAVDAVWGGAGWEIGASRIDDPAPWRAGHQVISR